MAGSRKGEHRGGAKPGHVSTKPKAVTVAKPRKTPRAPKRSEEYYREITAVIHGNDMRRRDEPREVMLEAMQYFVDCARNERSLKEDMVRSLARCTTDQEFSMVSDMLGNSEQRIKELYQLALDAGFKVAPYVHSKMSSIEISGPDKGPIEIIGMLLKDIHDANRGRPSWAPPDLELEAERLEP